MFQVGNRAGCNAYIIANSPTTPMIDPELYHRHQGDDPPYISRIDRGPAAFFHGRNDIRTLFREILVDARGTHGGTTFLVQGAPGAGKSALLHQLYTKADGWTVAHIGSQELWSPATMTQALGKAYTVSRNLSGGLDAKIFHGSAAKELAGDASAGEVLCHHTPAAGVILVLDEAQKLRKIRPENIEAATDTLDAIHNGNLGKPAILLTGGLGTTKDILKTLDVSRFGDGCTHEIGPLSKKAERDVITDWLTLAGGARGDVSMWVDTITEKTHAWPQHMVCYALRARDILFKAGGEMTNEGLSEVLRQGAQARDNYYKARTDGLHKEDIQIIAQLFATMAPNDATTHKKIIKALATEHPPEAAERLFQDLLHRGVIARTDEGAYQIPIPSFHTWITKGIDPPHPPKDWSISR